MRKLRQAAAWVGSASIAMALAVLPSGSARAADLTVTNYGVTMTTLPWGIALKNGYFKQNNVPITGILKTAGGGTSIRVMMANPIPVAQVGTAAAIATKESGIDLIMIYSPVNNMGDVAWVTLATSPYKTLADLKGTKIAYTNPRSTTELILRSALKASGLGNDVQAVASGSIPAGFTMLDAGAVAANPTDEPLIWPPGKYRVLFMANQFVPALTWEIGVTTRDFAQKNPDLVRGIVKSFRMGVDYIYSHPEEAAQLHSVDFASPIDISRKLMPMLAKSNFWSRGNFNEEGLKTMEKGLADVGAISKPIDVMKMVDTSYLPPDLQK